MRRVFTNLSSTEVYSNHNNSGWSSKEEIFRSGICTGDKIEYETGVYKF